MTKSRFPSRVPAALRGGRRRSASNFLKRLGHSLEAAGQMLDRSLVLWGSAHLHAFDGPIEKFADSTGETTELRA